MIEMKAKGGWAITASKCNDTFILKVIRDLDGKEYMLSTTGKDDNRMYLARYGVQLTEEEAERLNDQLRNAPLLG